MNTQKMLLLIAILGLVAFAGTNAFAAPANYDSVTVLQAGDTTMTSDTFKKVTPSIQFLLTGGTAPNALPGDTIAYAVKGQESRMLAVALTAMANNSKVNIIADLSMPKGAAPVVYKIILVGAQ